MKSKKSILTRILEVILKDTIVRTLVTRQSHSWFFNIYFSDYVEYETAPFQHEMFRLTEQTDWSLLCLMAFRGSSKSTVMNTSYALWSILGSQQKKYVLILCQTRSQAKQYMMNIRGAVERDNLLKKDLGPFKEDSLEWGSSSIVFPKYGARITVGSSEQSLRGTRHNQHRPDLVIVDDAEDVNSVKTKEGRYKTYNWFKSEIIPCGSKRTRYIVIGNMLHEECLTARLIEEMQNEELDGIWRKYPILDEDDKILWLGKYPTMEDIEKERKKIGNEKTWQQEYMLNPVSDDERVIDPKWIKRCERIPKLSGDDYRGTYMAVDPAISENDSACFTGIVIASVFGDGDNRQTYIHPNPINERLNFHNARERIKALVREMDISQVFVESGGYQKALADDLHYSMINVEPVTVAGLDKRSRLAIAAAPMEAGRIYFPKFGTKDLERQLTGFPVEKYDDMADAFSMLIRKTADIKPVNEPEVFNLGG